MRLLTWNIHKGIGSLDRRYDFKRIIDVIDHYQPDVVTMQEVDQGVPRSRGDDQTQLLASVIGYPYYIFGANVDLKQGRYGNATLSRFPIRHWQNIDLTFTGKKSRGALYTELTVPQHGRRLTVHVVNIHLGLSGMERRWQIRRLLESDDIIHLDSGSRMIVSGDTNDWSGALVRGRLRQMGFRCATGTGARASLTFPSWGPVGALDRVLVRGALAEFHHTRARLSLASSASDHLPVVIDMDVVPMSKADVGNDAPVVG
ncbi:MAG: endonuclease [marine bacterium B5-7]|nr:MAG: endonuclease [marine bacterium B5-7]